MAKRRMFSLDVIDTDAFLDLPLTTQALYFHLGMRADDDGFVSSPRRILAMTGGSADDLKLLVSKGFAIPFPSGVCVIRDWRINNQIQKDRYHETLYLSEKSLLQKLPTGAYALLDTSCIQGVSSMDTQVSIEKISPEQLRSAEVRGSDKPPRAPRFTPPTREEVADYCRERKNDVDPKRFVDFYTANGWMQGKGKPIKDWKAAVRTWEGRDSQRATYGSPPKAGGRTYTDADYAEGW